MFKRRKNRTAEQDRYRTDEVGRQINEAFDGLRGMVFAIEPGKEGMPAGPGAWGGLMDMGMGNGAATLVCLRDGTTSLYVSSGGGILGGEGHEAVVHANAAFLDVLTEHAKALRPDPTTALPAPGRVILRALTHNGPLSFEADEDDLGNNRSPLSPAFHAAHAAISELRLIAQG